MLKRMKYALYIFAFASGIASTMIDAGVFIIVHGTWSKASSWYAPGGNFFDLLEKNLDLKFFVLVLLNLYFDRFELLYQHRMYELCMLIKPILLKI